MTSRYSWSVLIVLNSLLFFGCATSPPAHFPEAPRDWQIVSSSERELGSCRSLEGTYLMLAEQITYLQGIWQQKATSDLAFYSGLVGPAKAARIPESRIKLDDLNLDDALHDKSFQIRIDTANDLYLNYFVDENSSYSLHYSSGRGEFSCENGTITFPTRIDVSGGEGVQANSQRLRTMGLNIDGDLILNDWSSPARSSHDVPKPTFSIVRFTRKNGD